MSKIDNFKNFISNHTEFVDYVKNNRVSWQTLFELYDLYGEDESVWSKYLSNNTIKDNVNIKGILNTLKNINLDSLEENISSIQKAVSLIEEFTKKEESDTIKPKEDNIDNLYGDKDGKVGN